MPGKRRLRTSNGIKKARRASRRRVVAVPILVKQDKGWFPRKLDMKAFRSLLLGWAKLHGRGFPWRRRCATNYERVVSEVLLQRTTAEVVARMFPSFARRYPSWAALSKASILDLEALLRPIGLWKRRARVLSALSYEVRARRGRFPDDRAELEKLPGVGQYVANAVLMFCHGQPQPLLDSGMARVLERNFGDRKLADIRYDPYLKEVSKRVIDCEDAARLNWAILDLGALVCTIRNPSCSECPLRNRCLYPRKVTRHQRRLGGKA